MTEKLKPYYEILVKHTPFFFFKDGRRISHCLQGSKELPKTIKRPIKEEK